VARARGARRRGRAGGAVSRAPVDKAELAAAWACLALAGSFAAWTLTAGPATLQGGAEGLAHYLRGALPAAAAALVACGVLGALGAGAWAARLAWGSGLVYAGVAKAAGFVLAPWLAVVAAVAVAVLARRPVAAGGALVLAHAMGTAGGLYVAFTLARSANVAELLDVLRGLWWMVG